MRRLWLVGCQVRVYLSAPWSLGKVNVPLNQTSGRPASLSAGRCCSLPAEFKVHSHLLPETYPEPQNGGSYALIKLSWGRFDSRLWWSQVMKRLYVLKTSLSQLHWIVRVEVFILKKVFLLLTFTRYALFIRLSLHIKDDFNATVWNVNMISTAHHFTLKPWEEIPVIGRVFFLGIVKHLVFFFSSTEHQTMFLPFQKAFSECRRLKKCYL